MKIAMVTDYPLHADSVNGGVQAVSMYLVEAMRKMHDVDVFVVTFQSGRTQHEIVRVGEVDVHVLPKGTRGALTRYRDNRYAFRKCVDSLNPDIVHGQGIGREGFVALSSGYPGVVTIHGVLGEDARYLSDARKRLRNRFKSFISERFCVSHAGHIISISPYVEQYYQKRIRGTVHAISNPVSEVFYSVKRAAKPGRILFAGKIIPRKAIVDLIGAMGLLKDRPGTELVIAGDTDDYNYLARVKEEVARQGVESSVTFLGLLDERQLLDEFAKAALLVLPSYQETAPMVILQAMAAGLPVVATAVCGVPELVRDGETGLLLEPGDVGQLAAHMRKLVDDDILRESMSAASLKASPAFRADAVAERTVAVYEQVLGRDRAVKPVLVDAAQQVG